MKELPDFAIAQNDRTFQSSIWVKKDGEWKSLATEDFDTVKMMAEMIRQANDPTEVANQFIQIGSGDRDFKL